MRIGPFLVGMLASAFLAACPGSSTTPVSGGGNGTGACTTCRRTGGGTGGGGTSGGGSTGGGSTGASTSGGSSGAASTGGDAGACNTVANPPAFPLDCTGISPFFTGDAGDCPGDWFGTVITDYSSCDPVCGLTFQLLDSNALPIAGLSQPSDSPTGEVHLCLPSGLTYTPSVYGNGYATYYWGEIQGQVTKDVRTIGVFKTVELQALSNVVPGGLDPTKASGEVGFLNSGANCPARTGWTLTLDDLDGGAYPAGSYEVFYTDSDGIPDVAQKSTSSDGAAFLVNLAVPAGTFVVPVYQNPDAGACAVQNEAIGYTGRLYVAPGDFSEQIIYLE
jgi:hypothetical protein